MAIKVGSFGSVLFGNMLQVLAMLHALRKVCNHPACLDPEPWAAGRFLLWAAVREFEKGLRSYET